MKKGSKTFNLLILFIGCMSLFFSDLAFAKNADLSRCLKNLPDSASSTEPGNLDFAQEVIVSSDTIYVL